MGIGSLIVFVFLLPFYFLPAIIAIIRGKTNKVAIIVLNILVGWTFIGWVIALVWSLMKDKK
ncbi:superinfection immunity protein [bacterium LRH843]|nr:superinfection immunity protein [bacterium LRH843]